MFCPKCKCEFRDGYEKCNNCGCELVSIDDIDDFEDRESHYSKENSKIVTFFIMGFVYLLIEMVIDIF